MAPISRRDGGKVLLAGWAGTLVPARGLATAEMINAGFNSVTGEISAPAATNYYISQSSGNGNHDGKSLATAWQTLARASTNYSGGDRILLKCGDTWQKDELYPHGSGTASDPITIWSHGMGNRPVLDGLDSTQDRIPIHLNDDEGYRIIGVEFNRCMTGIYAEYSDTSANRKYLWIDSCFFHDSLLYQHYEDYPQRKIGTPHFVDFGRNMEHSPDGKAYLVGHSTIEPDPKPRFANNNRIAGNQLFMARVPPTPSSINDATQYEFFAGLDPQGRPAWSPEFSKIQPLVDWNNHYGCVTITFNSPLRKYLMCVADPCPVPGR